MKRKATKNTHGPNAEEKAFQKWIKHSEKCFACRKLRPVIMHHCEGSTFKHNKTLIGHWFCIGLCQECDDIITHGSRKAFRENFGPQSDIWHEWIDYYSQRGNAGPDDDVYMAILGWGK